MSEKLEIIILAAGSSSRLGQAKQLVTLNGESLLSRQCKIAKQMSEHVSCVVGFQAQEMINQIDDANIKVVVNDHWQAGLASSIAKGVSELDEDTDAVMLMLVDQWQLEVKHFLRIKNLWLKNPEHIISAGQCSHDKKLTSPPVIFPAYCFSLLSQLHSGSGAKSVIKHFHHQLISEIMPEAFVDLDVPEQLQKLKDNEMSQKF
ncbi:nucleotidyltransferase family protein [Thalassotalea sp. SU-HH00458]|uniref:nucleotidyltransferase family protein n=1 Tax=Thalassotalea sp. SU-HH00458 TaxID=3127657 RepID=UPI0031056F8C